MRVLRLLCAIGSVLCALLVAPALPSAAALRGTDAGRAATPSIFVGARKMRVTAVVDRGRVFVPVRGVFEAIHASVDYAPPHFVVVRKDGVVIAGFILDRPHIQGGRQVDADAGPLRRDGRIYVPLRTVAQAAGATVTYTSHPAVVHIRERSRPAVASPLPLETSQPAGTDADAEQSARPSRFGWLPGFSLVLGLCLVAGAALYRYRLHALALVKNMQRRLTGIVPAVVQPTRQARRGTPPVTRSQPRTPPEQGLLPRRPPTRARVQPEPTGSAPEDAVDESYSKHLVPTVSSVEPAPMVSSVEPAPMVAAVEPMPLMAAVEPMPLMASVEPTPTVASVEPTPTVLPVQPAQTLVSVEPAPTMAPVDSAPTIAAPQSQATAPSLREPAMPLLEAVRTTPTGSAFVRQSNGAAHNDTIALTTVDASGEARFRKERITERRTIEVPVTREELVIEYVGDGGTVIIEGRTLVPGETVRIPLWEERVNIDITKHQILTADIVVEKRRISGPIAVKDRVYSAEVGLIEPGPG